MFTNAGYTTEEVANRLNIHEADLLNSDNWDNDVFTAGDKSYKFTFTYTGDILTEIV